MSRQVLDMTNDKLEELFQKTNGNFEEVYQKATELDQKNTSQDAEIANKASQAEHDTLKARVDLLTQTPSSETEGNAELLDIRVGADGRTYPTAGNAVRSIAVGEGLSDDSIRLPHIDFLTSDNLAFGRLIKKFKLAGSTSATVISPGANFIDPSQKFYTIMLVLKPNTDYTFFNATNLERESNYYWTKILLTDLSPAEVLNLSKAYNVGLYTAISTKDYADHINFSTQEDNLTCIIQISQDIYPDYIELREGTFNTRKYSNYLESLTPVGPVYTKDQVYNKAEVDELLLGKSHLSKSGDYIYLTMNSKVSYTLRHRVDDSIKVDTWLIQSGSVAGNLLWQGTDIEAPIKEVGAADFVGGIHGDETMQDVIILADGVILDLDQDYELDFNKLTVFVTSTLYHCNTTNPAFTRYKKLEFEGGELIVSNRMICLSDFSVNRYTGCGLYSVYKDQLSGYSTNLENILKTDSGTNNSPELTKVTFYGGGFTIDIETLSGKGEHFSGSVADFSTEARPRFKAYLDCINSSGVQLQANDELNASFRINIV